ncbi:MAG: LCP family protein [Anaerolineae bacterium]
MQNQPARMYERNQARHWSKTRGCLVSIFVGLLLTLCACTASLALYIAFPPASTDILIMGLDSRGNEGSVTRTDSIAILGINPSRLRASLLSIPRDVFISVPNYGQQRVNTINVLAEADARGTGPRLLADAIAMSFDIQVDRYVRLDFEAFTTLVNAIGGITVDVPTVIVDNAFPTADYGTIQVRFEAGRQQMNGDTALIYARTRHQDDDYRRVERQQQVMAGIARKLLNPFNWGPAWLALQSNTETDLTLFDVIRVAPVMLFSAGDFNMLVINRDYVVPGNGFVMPNYEALRPYIEENFD